MAEHQLSAVWAKILRTAREEKNFSLFGLLSTLNDVEFVDGKILLHAHNDAEKNLLKQNLDTLQSWGGVDAALVLQDNTVVVADENRDFVARLKDLFGDKVEIV